MTFPVSSGAFGGGRRKAIRLAQEDLVRTSFLPGGRDFPLLVEPSVDGVNLTEYALGNRDFIEGQLDRHGGLLFRGFGLPTPEAFQDFVAACSHGALEYTERSSPRSRVSGNIYTSTDYPPNQPIFLHNEQSYNVTFPHKIFFFCVTASPVGGGTPIADCRRVLARIPAEVRERFERLGYLYVRNFGDGLGLSWKEAFQTDSRGEVEEYCRAHRIDFEWKDGERLRTRQLRQVVARHPRTGEESWFNHLTFFHVSTLVPEIRDALLAELGPEDLPNNTFYGDGGAIEPEVLDELRRIYHEETVVFPWQKGDVLMLDNMLTAHGREPFEGARKVVVGMADPTSWDAVRG